MKKIYSLIMVGVLLIGSTASFANSDENENIIEEFSTKDIEDSMTFKGEASNLTLEKALEEMLNENPKMLKAKLGDETAYARKQDFMGPIRDARKYTSGEREEGTTLNIKLIKIPDLQSDYLDNLAERNIEAIRENLKYELEEAYYNGLHAKDLLKINKESYNRNKELYEQAEQKLDLGLISKKDLIEAEKNLLESESAYTKAKNDFKLAKMNINSKLNNNLMKNFTLEGELTKIEDFELGSIKDGVTSALDNRNELKASEFNYKIKAYQFELTSRRLTSNTYTYKNAYAASEDALRDYEMARKNIEMDIRNQYLDIEHKASLIDKSIKQKELAKEMLDFAKLSYELGQVVLTDVQQAENAYKQASLGASNAILEYNLAVIKYEDSTKVGYQDFELPNFAN